VGLFSGACKVSFFEFLAASLVGFIPLTLVFCLVGNGGYQGRLGLIFIGLGSMALLYAGTVVFKRKWPQPTGLSNDVLSISKKLKRKK
jgi:uncharacterized membrane protein YdjX (TVP38/TMEM64 family)